MPDEKLRRRKGRDGRKAATTDQSKKGRSSSPEPIALRVKREPAGAAKPKRRARSIRDTRRHGCEGCPHEDTCELQPEAGAMCPIEKDGFTELIRPKRIPKLLRDAIAAEFRSYFRAKRLEARKADKLDGEASKMLQGLLKAVDAYLDINQRVEEGSGDGDSTRAMRLHPTLAAALAASSDGLFSEVGDEGLREQLRQEYIAAIKQEDAILRTALSASGLRAEVEE